ncbi:hypothetical protein [Methylicorpusculum sp.]|uniref:hypothetical protein n=1 Tax=Methylicorpusculum sp. TaxID=2713644 RepID=UPI00271A94AC|nr:hypothetical protein [Methylicorpusculum sp.]MDO8845593.1 hypothetical protein [Methylicorpusculum sp.]
MLTLKGKIQPQKMLTSAERNELFSKSLTANVTQGVTGTGLPIETNAILTVQKNGNWTLNNIALPNDAPFSCKVTVDFEGKKSTRTIARAPKDCIK